MPPTLRLSRSLHFRGSALIPWLALLSTSGCGGKGANLPATPAFQLTSAAFAPGTALPADFTCDGSGHPPDLTWQGAPAATQSYALLVHDPDAPGGDFTHWMLCDIAPRVTALPTGSTAGIPGFNDFDKPGYGGPCPPSGTHHYVFTVMAVDVRSLGLNAGYRRSALDAALKGHVLAEAQLIATYAHR